MIRGLLNRKGGWIALAACAVLLFLAVNLGASQLSGARLDFTQDKLFTLSQGTRNILQDLDEPVTLTLYLSDRLSKEIPAFGNYATRVRDMLREFSTVSGGKLVVKVVNPVPFSEVEDAAVRAGIQGVPIDQGGEKVYFGLVGTTGGKDEAKRTEVIPFLQLEREAFLEYDLVRLVHTLAQKKKPVVAVLTSRPLFGDFRAQLAGMPTQPTMIIEQMQKLFDVRQIWSLADEENVDDIDVLVLAHAAGLNDKELYAIDQYLMRGGKALVFVDPYNETAAHAAAGGMPEATKSAEKLKKLMDAWGIEVVPGAVAGDRVLARMVDAGQGGKVEPVSYPVWLQLRDANISGKDPVTANISLVNMASAGILQVEKDATAKIEPLLTTTNQTQQISVEQLEQKPPKIKEIAQNFQPSGKVMMLGARISGVVKSAFPDGPPKEEKKADDSKKDDADAGKAKAETEGKEGEADAKDKKAEEKKPAHPHLAQSKGPINVILFSDADMLEDYNWVQVRDFFGQRFAMPTANNGDLVINAVDNLSGSDDLISLRSRGTARRPFTRIAALRQEAEAKFQAKEQRLAQKLAETEKKLQELKETKPGEAATQAALTDAQQAEIDKFTQELLDTRKQLRDVQLALRQDIDTLKNWLQFANIALIPLLVAVAAIVLGLVRMRRRRRAARA